MWRTINQSYEAFCWKNYGNPSIFIPILFLISPIYCIHLLGFIAFILFKICFNLFLNSYSVYAVVFFKELYCLKSIIKFAKLYDFTTCVYHTCLTLLSHCCQLYRINLSYNVYIVDTNVLANFEQLSIAKLVNSDSIIPLIILISDVRMVPNFSELEFLHVCLSQLSV